MFEVVARTNIHQQQVLNSLKQRAKLHASFLYSSERILSLEQNLLSHLYALVDADQSALKPQTLALVEALTQLLNKQSTFDSIVDVYQSAAFSEDKQINELANTMLLIVSLLPQTHINDIFSYSIEQSYLEEILYRNNSLLELLIHVDIKWPEELLQIARQSVLANQFTPSKTAACLLWDVEHVSSQELAQGYTHSNSSFAKASFVKGLTVDASNAQVALFNRFAKTTDTLEKVELLTLAGLTGDIRWVEPCTVFCQEYPEHTFNVLSFFQHKQFLTMVIKLMATPQCVEGAYQAWLLLTGEELQQKPQLLDVDNKSNYAGEADIPNDNQAELIRQQLMQQEGDKVLSGICFDDNNAVLKLNELQGRAVQGALLFSQSLLNSTSVAPTTNKAMPLYRNQLSANNFSNLIAPQTQLADNISQGAEHVT